MPITITISLLNAFSRQCLKSWTDPITIALVHVQNQQALKLNFIVISLERAISLLLNPVLLLANMDCIEAVAAAFVRHRAGGLHLDIHSHQVDVHPLTSRTQRTSRSHHSRLGCL